MNFGQDPFRKECGSYTDAAIDRAAIPGICSQAEQEQALKNDYSAGSKSKTTDAGCGEAMLRRVMELSR
jgi:hypothetical protein